MSQANLPPAQSAAPAEPATAIVKSNKSPSSPGLPATITDAIITAEQELLVHDHSLDARFTQKQLSEMNAMIPEYNVSLRKQKSHITRTLSDQFIKEIIESGVELDKTKRGRILENVRYWFTQRCRVRDNTPTFFHPYSSRQVFYKENVSLVKKTQRKLYCKALGLPPSEVDESDEEREDLDAVEDGAGSSEGGVAANGKLVKPFDFFQVAITREFNRLSEEEKAEYEKKAMEWRVQGPTDDVKQERAEKDIGRYLHSFAEQMFKQMGVKLYFFVSYKNRKNQTIRAQHDFGKRLYGAHQNFRESVRPVIIRSGAWNRWIQFTRDESSPTGGPGAEEPGELLHLPLNEYGEVVIPNPDEKAFPKTDPPFKYLQKVVRCVVSHANALAMGKPIENYKPGEHNCCRWGVIERDPFKFIKRECFPEGEEHISDPSGLRKPRTAKFVQHWWERQQKGLPAFEFHSYVDSEGNIKPAFPRRRSGEEETSPRRSTRKVDKGGRPVAGGDASSSEEEEGGVGPRRATKRRTRSKKKVASGPREKLPESLHSDEEAPPEFGSSGEEREASDEEREASDEDNESHSETFRKCRRVGSSDEDRLSESGDEGAYPRGKKALRRTPVRSTAPDTLPAPTPSPQNQSPSPESPPQTPERTPRWLNPKTPRWGLAAERPGQGDSSARLTPPETQSSPQGHSPNASPRAISPSPEPRVKVAPPHLPPPHHSGPSTSSAESMPNPPANLSLPPETHNPTTSNMPAAPPGYGWNGLLISQLAALLQATNQHPGGGTGPPPALVDLLGLQLNPVPAQVSTPPVAPEAQTPSRALADGLKRVHIDASPSKPSASRKEAHRRTDEEDMVVDHPTRHGRPVGGDDNDEDNEREGETEIGSTSNSRAERSRGNSTRSPEEVHSAGQTRRNGSRAEGRGKEEGKALKGVAVPSRKGKARARAEGFASEDEGTQVDPVNADGPTHEGGEGERVRTRRRGLGGSKSANSLPHRSKSTSTKARSEGANQSKASQVMQVPPSPSKADQRMLDYTRTLVGESIGAKRERKKRTREF